MVPLEGQHSSGFHTAGTAADHEYALAAIAAGDNIALVFAPGTVVDRTAHGLVNKDLADADVAVYNL